MLELELEKNRDPSGSTCVLALLHENYLLVSWIGDSRCVLCRGKKCIPMTVDHTPLRYDEKKRIEKMGGKVNLNDNTGDAPRVMQSLAVTRSFGDIKLKRNKFLIAEPEFTETLLEPEDRFVILASDGLWDVMSEEEAVAFVLSSEEPLSVSEQLLKRAIELGSVDNLSVIVVYFTWTLEKKL
uniref:PPM-type phosphatase domain-containing protein n=1 Tax=Arcella intermedia TaxID=1963864 RepID=A0A6B2LG99_9EUKA